MVAGESHNFWGRLYCLQVVEGSGTHVLRLSGRSMRLHVQPNTSVANKALVLTEFYRKSLKKRLSELMAYWQPRIGVEAMDWGVRLMRTKWGSCNTSARRILFNLELAKKPPECVEYIVVHELVHLRERHHNKQFKTLMDGYLPNWRERQKMLNHAPLAAYEGKK